MLGVSLVTADNWIINHFASHTGGAISLLAYAKQLFTAPVALGQAAEPPLCPSSPHSMEGPAMTESPIPCPSAVPSTHPSRAFSRFLFCLPPS